jgi:peptidyl-prolyl cis-trans isomerase C
MKLKTSAALIVGTLVLPLAAMAQNIAVVNGKPVPKARAEALLKQATRAGQQVTPELQQQANDQVVLREIFTQEAERQGIQNTKEFQDQMALVRQSVLLQTLFQNYAAKVQVTDAEAKAEYDKIKAEQGGQEYHARHILVDNEDEAKKLIAQLKSGAKFDELAKKNSKDTGSAENGGDLDWAKPNTYVPEFAAALQKLKPGEMTDTPVKTQFGYHIIKLEDVRAAQFPNFDDVKEKIKENMKGEKVREYQEKLRKSAKTDYKFADEMPRPAAAARPATPAPIAAPTAAPAASK